MELRKGLHKLCFHFVVTESIKRFVYVYVLVGEHVHIIDAGVDGSHRPLGEYLAEQGLSFAQVKTLLLTHTHPDHIGAAFLIHQLSGCHVMGPAREREWVENVNKQFAERPVPNFFTLVKHSVTLQTMLEGGETLQLEPGITLRVIDSSGHSAGSLSYYWEEENVVFCGDAIPVAGDVLAFDHPGQARASLDRLEALQPALYLSAWDTPFDLVSGQQRIAESRQAFLDFEAAVKKHASGVLPKKDTGLYQAVAKELGMPQWVEHPLFGRSVAAVERVLKEEKKAKKEKRGG